MELNIKYFGMIADATGHSCELLDSDCQTVGELCVQITDKYKGLNKMSYKVAVNRQIVQGDYLLSEGQEIAFLPHMAGG